MPTSLSDRCAAVSRLAEDALGWLALPASQDRLGAERRPLEKALTASRRRAAKLARAAGSRMAVSVFGPSQAGKSFLVSVLARPEGGRLVIDCGGRELDYIREMNPEGEGESTGLVTRFTAERRPGPPGFPIRMRLLTVADLLRVLANSFVMDGDGSDEVPGAEAITAQLDRFRDRAGAPRPGLSDADLAEVADYLRDQLARQSPHAAALAPFLAEAARIAPGLSTPDRAEFLSPLWGGHEAFTALFRQLAEELDRLGHPDEAFVALDAVVPRATSILDVKTLGGIADADGPPVALALADGRTTSLARGAACALAAELVLPMRDLPHPLFETTDLLDFPGARNRFGRPLAATLATTDGLPGLFLRGKVAYLFDRYVEEQEITSMLLCVPDSNMETVDLPRLVGTWVGRTHGVRPEQRAAVDCLLFLVLTKFDKHLVDSAAAAGDASRFQRRMEASLLEKFGQGREGWLEEWAPGTPFRNCFWLRNPNFYAEALFDYDEARRERRVRPDKEGRLAALRAGSLAAPAVQRHFEDPGRAWDAALTLNDGGVGALVEALSRVCRPDQKRRQIEAQLAAVAGDMARALRLHHVPDDLQGRVAQRRAALDPIIDDLHDALQRHRFGALLAALMVDQEEIETRIARVPPDVRIGTALAAAQPGGPGRAIRPGRPAPPGEGRETVRSMTLEAYQAEEAQACWIEAMQRLARDEALCASLGLRGRSAADLVAELVAGATRLGLARAAADELARTGYGLTPERLAPAAAVLGAERLNAFVSRLGMDARPLASRPVVRGEGVAERPVFHRPPAADSVLALPEMPAASAEDYWSDWVFSLEALVVENARSVDGAEVDAESNDRLGGILAALDGATTAAGCGGVTRA